MIKNISVKLVNGVGIKLFRIPIREDEINKLNIHQIYKLFATKSVKEVWEHNDDNSKKIRLTISNYKDIIDWDKVSISDDKKENNSSVNVDDKKPEEKVENTTKEENNKEPEKVEDTTKKENNKESEKVEDAKESITTDENIKTVEFEGEEYEEIVDDNYDPEMGIDPDKK